MLLWIVFASRRVAAKVVLRSCLSVCNQVISKTNLCIFPKFIADIPHILPTLTFGACHIQEDSDWELDYCNSVSTVELLTQCTISIYLRTDQCGIKSRHLVTQAYWQHSGSISDKARGGMELNCGPFHIPDCSCPGHHWMTVLSLIARL